MPTKHHAAFHEPWWSIRRQTFASWRRIYMINCTLYPASFWDCIRSKKVAGVLYVMNKAVWIQVLSSIHKALFREVYIYGGASHCMCLQPYNSLWGLYSFLKASIYSWKIISVFLGTHLLDLFSDSSQSWNSHPLIKAGSFFHIPQLSIFCTCLNSILRAHTMQKLQVSRINHIPAKRACQLLLWR